MFLKKSLLIGELLAWIDHDGTLENALINRRFAMLRSGDLEDRGIWFVFTHPVTLL